MPSRRDLDIVGRVSFLSCITCKVGCALPTIHQNVTKKDMERGLDSKYVDFDENGSMGITETARILKKREGGGCVLLDDATGCQVADENRPIACLVCPMQIDSNGYIVANVFCPDALKIAQGLLNGDEQVIAYVSASARLMLEDAEFCRRSAEFVDRYTSKLILGKAKELALLDNEQEG